MIRTIRQSFALKLFTGLLGTVAVLLAVTYAVVRSVTALEVQATSQRVAHNATEQFDQLEEIRRQEVARVARLLTEGRRTMAALDEGDIPYLTGEVLYQAALFDLRDVVVAFTDARGRPILTLHGDAPLDGEDPVGLRDAAGRVLGGEGEEVRSYRVLEGALFSFRTQLVQLAGRPIGTLSLGLPVPDDEVARIGALAGVEACFVVRGTCVAGTAAGRGRMGELLASLSAPGNATQIRAMGSAWSVTAQPLIADDPDQGSRVVAVPLDLVLAPYNRIAQALLLGGCLALLLAVVVGFVLSRGLTRPVRALVEATGRVARGEYDAEVPVTTGDEMGALSESFNQMTRELLLKDRMHSVLNKVVSRDVAQELLQGNLTLGGENRRVTVLFADIRGFSSLVVGMEPQGVIALLNECMQLLSDAVDAEGGVVDKYVGDELMAIFGAPVSREDDALRAARTALRMQQAMSTLNTERLARGDPAIGLGVGLNTGVVVAGNMGSKERLNYTVLGDAVNLGARLCAGAAAGEILATRACVEAAGGSIRARPLGRRTFKGFSDEVEVLSVEGLDGLPGARAPGAAVAGLLVALVLLAPVPLRAQGLPTLRDLGAEYISPSGGLQVGLSGQLDLEGLFFSRDRFGLAEGGAQHRLVAPRLRLFTDVFVGDHAYALIELRGDRGDPPRPGEWDARVEQAFVRVGTGSGSLSLQAGRFASPFGGYASRHLTSVDPFVRPPLVYDDRTMMCAGIAPLTVGGFLTWKDRPDEFRDVGAPPVWGVPYQWGAMVAGARGAVGYRVAVMNSAPSSAPEAWGWSAERMRHPSLVAAVSAAVTPELSLTGSFSRGPWLEELTRGTFPSGMDRWDYMQTLFAVTATWARGPLLAHAEAVHDRWEVPNLTEAPVEWGGSVEVQGDLAAGVFVGLRAGLLDFRPVMTSGGPLDWDYDVERFEASLGYRLDRNAGLLGSWMTKTRRSRLEGPENLMAVRLWWAF